jgi:hypothetical protein
MTVCEVTLRPSYGQYSFRFCGEAGEKLSESGVVALTTPDVGGSGRGAETQTVCGE